MRVEPILKLGDEEKIKSLFCDQLSGAVLVGTSQGRILLIKQLASNALLSGNRTIYANRQNGTGETSKTSHVNVKYGLVNKIAEMTDSLSISRWKNVISPFSAESYSTISGVFTTPVLWAGEDFGWWGTATWNQTVGLNNKVVLAIRVSGSESSLASSKWITYESATSGSQSWILDELSTAGGYAQMKIVLTSTSMSENPVISSLVIPYYTKHASYYFTTKISMAKGSSIKGGLLTASVSVPRNTDIKWGVSNKNSFNWNDFVGIDQDKLFSLPENFGDRIKIGAKILAYDNERYATVNEFSVAFDADVDNLINKI